MKGPYERLKYDLRRTWECPKCLGRQQTDGTTTGIVCECQLVIPENERLSMKLLRDGVRLSPVKQPTSSSPPDQEVDGSSPASPAQATSPDEERTETAPPETGGATNEDVANSSANDAIEGEISGEISPQCEATSDPPEAAEDSQREG